MPDSTDTIFKVGWRSSTPEKMRLASTRALVRYIMAEPMASFWSSPCDGHGDVPNQPIELSLAPMWKLIGSSWSQQNSHSGRQSSSPRSGSPRSWGSLHITMPPQAQPDDALGLGQRALDVPPWD